MLMFRLTYPGLMKNSLRKFINDENWYLNLNRARHLEPHARFVRPQCIHARHTDIPSGKLEGSEDPQLALYVSLCYQDPRVHNANLCRLHTYVQPLAFNSRAMH